MMSQNLCRFCLLENPPYAYNIFDGTVSHALYEYLSQSVNFEPNDGLPETICGECWMRVRQAIEFRHRCVENDKELRRRNEEAFKIVEDALGTDNLGRFDINDMGGGEWPSHPLEGENLPTRVENDSTAALDFEMLEMTMLNKLLVDENSIGGFPDEGDDFNEFLNRILYNSDMPQSSSIQPEPAEAAHETSTIESMPTPSPQSSCSSLSPSFTIPTTATIHEENSISDTAYDSCSAITSSSCDSTSSSTQSPKSPRSVYSCSECSKRFTRNFQLKLHLISVHNIGNGLQYHCPTCGKTFASRHSLSYHEKSLHSSERNFACPHCSRRFVLRTQLVSHIRIHTGEIKPRIHECMHCGKCWPTKSDLRTHMRSHNPDMERPFKCHLCEKAFFTRGHLKSHLLVHSGEKPFACVFCDKSYQSVGNLNNHLVRQHGDLMMRQSVGEE